MASSISWLLFLIRSETDGKGDACLEGTAALGKALTTADEIEGGVSLVCEVRPPKRQGEGGLVSKRATGTDVRAEQLVVAL